MTASGSSSIYPEWGSNHIAQGCRASGYPGLDGEAPVYPEGVASSVRRQVRQPIRGRRYPLDHFPRVAAGAATLGFETNPFGVGVFRSIGSHARGVFLPLEELMSFHVEHRTRKRRLKPCGYNSPHNLHQLPHHRPAIQQMLRPARGVGEGCARQVDAEEVVEGGEDVLIMDGAVDDAGGVAVGGADDLACA